MGAFPPSLPAGLHAICSIFFLSHCLRFLHFISLIFFVEFSLRSRLVLIYFALHSATPRCAIECMCAAWGEGGGEGSCSSGFFRFPFFAFLQLFSLVFFFFLSISLRGASRQHSPICMPKQPPPTTPSLCPSPSPLYLVAPSMRQETRKCKQIKQRLENNT